MDMSHHRRISTLILLASLILFGCSVSLLIGTIPLSPLELVQALIHQGNELHHTIIWELRLPRIITALLVGASLGTAGALLQGLLRNDLADPFILGVSSGAGLVAIAIITFGMFTAWLPIASWLGAMITSAIVFTLGRTQQGMAVERLILGGVAISAFFGSIQTLLLLLSDDGRLQAALYWLIGSLNGRGWSEISLVFPYILLGLSIACGLGKSINILNLGDEMAMGLGINLVRTRILIAGIAALLAASSVSVAGLIGFVGLIVPHSIRLLVGHDYRWVLPLSGLGGAFVLLIADSLTRFSTVELPVGAITALMGAPAFAYLLYRRSR